MGLGSPLAGSAMGRRGSSAPGTSSGSDTVSWMLAASTHFEPRNNRNVSFPLLSPNYFAYKVMIVSPNLADNCRKIIVGAQCLAPNRYAVKFSE